MKDASLVAVDRNMTLVSFDLYIKFSHQFRGHNLVLIILPNRSVSMIATVGGKRVNTYACESSSAERCLKPIH